MDSKDHYNHHQQQQIQQQHDQNLQQLQHLHPFSHVMDNYGLTCNMIHPNLRYPFDHLMASAAAGPGGVGFTLHVIMCEPGEDIASKIVAFSRQATRTVSILSASGAISNVTIEQPSLPRVTVKYEDQYQIIALSGSFTFSESYGEQNPSGWLNILFAGKENHVLGGLVAGELTAATPVQNNGQWGSGDDFLFLILVTEMTECGLKLGRDQGVATWVFSDVKRMMTLAHSIKLAIVSDGEDDFVELKRKKWGFGVSSYGEFRSGLRLRMRWVDVCGLNMARLDNGEVWRVLFLQVFGNCREKIIDKGSMDSLHNEAKSITWITYRTCRTQVFLASFDSDMKKSISNTETSGAAASSPPYNGDGSNDSSDENGSSPLDGTAFGQTYNNNGIQTNHGIPYHTMDWPPGR